MSSANTRPIEETALPALIGHREMVQAGDTLEAVHRRFSQHQFDYMAVMSGEQLAGLCARDQVGMVLGARFGFAMNSRRPISEMMLPAVTKISVNEPLPIVLRKVFTRPDEIFFDDVLLVDEQGVFLGVIFARTLVRLQQALFQQNIIQLEAKQAELNRKNEELENDLRMASEIQSALLPQQYPELLINGSQCLRFYHRYNPSGVVSGDFFHIFAIDAHTVGVFICDVMGHGVRSALITAMLRALVQELSHLGGNPGELLTRVNCELKAILKQTGELIYATGLYLCLDVETGRIRYAKAAHPDPLWLRQETATVSPLACPANRRGAALGLFEGSTYGTVESHVEAGDTIFFLTDGVFEVFDADGEEFGEKQFAQAIQNLGDQPLKAKMDALIESARNFSATRAFDDDVCFVGMEILQVARPVSLAG